MCGIAGLISAPPIRPARTLISRVLDCLAHRGPDDQGWLRFSRDRVRVGSAPAEIDEQAGSVAAADGAVYLLHRRLAILDLTETGHQPMSTADGRYHIVFNGEIYNYLELRRELEAMGYRFRSTSDTEVLLNGFAAWGREVLARLVGMFAFAVLDTRQRRLFLARDFFGIKPLYYATVPARAGSVRFAFASEIKALLELPGIGRHIDADRLYLYLRFGLTSHGSQTLFADVQQLPPGHYLDLSLDDPRMAEPVCYWRPEVDQPADLSFESAADRLRELFVESVQLHLRSDVPVGSALSGGIDSSSIVMAMRAVQGSDLELHTFGYVADDPAINEERWIRRVGRVAEATVHTVRPTPEELVADLDALIDCQDEPFSSTSLYAQRRVFELAHGAGIKVMLDGQGADELLAGYRPLLAARLASLLRQGKWGQAATFACRASRLPDSGGLRSLFRAVGLLLPAGLKDKARSLVGEELVPDWLNGRWFADRGVQPRSLRCGQHRSRSSDVLREQLYQILTETSLPMLLRYEDRNSMAFSIESRVPFLTPALVNFVFSLPEAYLMGSDGLGKAVFRRAMRGLVPDDVLDRRDKIGFATPEQQWLGTLQPWVEQVLRSDAARQIPALNRQAMERQWQAVLNGRARFDSHVWRWVNLIRWVERFGVSFETG